MKHILLLALLISGTLMELKVASGNCVLVLTSELFSQSAINMMKPVPGKIKLNDKIDLSFFINQSIVFQYRLKVETPRGGETGIEKSLLNWSPWQNNDIRNINIPRLNKEGRYKLIVEYKTHSSNEVKRFERQFEVFVENLASGGIKSTTGNETKSETIKTEPRSVNEKVASSSKDPAGKQSEEQTQRIAKKIESDSESIKDDIKISEGKSEMITDKEIKDYNRLLSEALKKNDQAILRESVINGADINIRGVYGGNILHSIARIPADRDLIIGLKTKGVSLNEADEFGNTPLSFAILSGNDEYARLLIEMGSDLNHMNRQKLAPLHLASFLKNKMIVSELLKKGANVNLSGNAGYTPLHIAAEMNLKSIASDLLNNDADTRHKTDQGMTPKTLAKIQMNSEILGILKKGGGATFESGSESVVINKNQYTNDQYPVIEFNLPYREELVKRRKMCTMVQWISAPLFAVSAAGAVYLKMEANTSYTQHRDAETYELAQKNFDKAKNYDTYSLISSCVSLGSAYTFIHSTIKKGITTRKMRRTFY